MVTGLSLQEITLYYSTVTAEGGSGLLAWTVSDGFILDTQVPEAGMVMDGTGELCWLDPLAALVSC